MREPKLAAEVVQLERVQPNGWGWSMHLVRLRDGGVLVHSPAWLGEGTFEKIEAFGRPRALLAPNHFHNLGLKRYRERYPDIPAVASDGARPRLTKLGHAGLGGLGELEPLLPESARILVPDGLKTGEVILSLEERTGRSWLVTDAFFNVQRRVTGAAGFVMRRLRVVPGLQISRTYTLLGIRDRKAYRRWILDALERERPVTLRVSHGEPISHPELWKTLGELVQRRLGRDQDGR